MFSHVQSIKATLFLSNSIVVWFHIGNALFHSHQISKHLSGILNIKARVQYSCMLGSNNTNASLINFSASQVLISKCSIFSC